MAANLAHTELLGLIAEVAAAFIGFSLVVGLLQPDNKNAEVRIQAMRAVAELAIIAGAGAFLVLLLRSFNLNEEIVWRYSSGAIGAFWLLLHLLSGRRLEKAGNPWYKLELIKYVGWSALAAVVLLFVNAIIISTHAGAIYITALCIALADSAFVFVIATFRFENEEST